MKVSPLDMLTILYRILSVSDLGTLVQGRVYKLNKPQGLFECVVINALPVSQAQQQIGTANVNIYVPDLAQTREGKPDQVADTVRLNTLTSMALPLLTVYETGYDFAPVSMTLIEQPESKSHYMNIRIDFNFFPAPEWS